MSNVEITLLKHQYKFIFTNMPFPAIVGGLGSGKSQAGTDRLLRLMIDDKNVNTLYAMPTFDLLKLRALPGFEESLQAMGLSYKINKTEMTIRISGMGTIYLRSYDNPNRFISFEVGHAVVDEIDTLNKEDATLVWRKVSERVRQNIKGNMPNTIGCVTTPDQGLAGFVYAKWKKSPAKGYELIQASTYDNPFLPNGYTDQILENYDPVLADLYLRGEFVSLTQNKQFWAFNRERHHSDAVSNGDMLINYAIDFNVGGTCFVVFKRDGDKLIAIDEFVAKNTQEAITMIDNSFPDVKKVCFPDASGGNESANADLTSLALITQAGHRVNAPKANPSVRASINAVNNLLSKDRLLVNTVKCPMLTEALESLGYDKNSKPEKFNEHPAYDDFGDVTRYIVNRLYPVRRPTTITQGR